ncbi:hypothetical protein FHU36_004924 [Nonomuraea muscovyensis]|uniref:Uncharacterized protein n=1 Tax=Nonomuraea muscovyensis TaxID=1124761 RepID=A0A7X0F0C5_9ACTN|nr:hypothetical protein [Nonomuraea muscovyensis]MBB6348379.1 hypothetical protein [Nonomuraea muscovyensis]
MGSRTAISAGVLAVALVAIPLALPISAALADDCPGGGGLLGGVTDAVCDTVDKVTGTVDTLTGDTLKPVTGGLNETTDKVLGKVGEVAPTRKPGDDAGSDPTPSQTALLPEPLDEVCLPVLACTADRRAIGDPSTPAPDVTSPAPRSSRSPGSDSGTDSTDDDSAIERRAREEATVTPPTSTPWPPDSEPHQLHSDPVDEPVTDEPTADPDDARIDLLWPNPLVKDLTLPMGDRDVVRPSPPASDVLGTSLTIALLISAIAATRIVQQRRQRVEQPESIPFEPAPANTGRHRLA